MRGYPKPKRYIPNNPEKVVGDLNNIIMRSSWETRFARWLDTNPAVIRWGSEIKPIPYFSTFENKVRRYFPDFWVYLVDKEEQHKRLLIEIKPLSQVLPPKPKTKKTFLNEMVTWQKNQDKWKSAREWCQKNAFEFVIMTEKELGIKI